jgi:hypothetical protein
MISKVATIKAGLNGCTTQTRLIFLSNGPQAGQYAKVNI